LLRESLPAKRTAFGETKELPLLKAIDPFGLRSGKETPVIKELDRLGIGLSKPQREQDETPQAYKKRVAEEGPLYKQGLETIINSDAYGSVKDKGSVKGDDIRREMIRRAGETARSGSEIDPYSLRLEAESSLNPDVKEWRQADSTLKREVGRE